MEIIFPFFNFEFNKGIGVAWTGGLVPKDKMNRSGLI